MFELLSILLRKWKLIVGLTILVAIITAAVSLLLPNYYDSTVVFQPVSPATFDRNVVFPEEGSDAKISVFGGSKDSDRVITLGTSRVLYDYLIKKYKLYEHYEIQPDERYATFKLLEKLKKRYKIQKNALGSLEVIVSDVEPQFAADMANDIYTKLDSMNREVILSKKHSVVSILEKQHTDLSKQTTLLRDSIQNIITRNPDDTIRAGFLNKLLTESTESFANISKNLEQNKAILKLDQSTFHLFEKASPADRKARPQRSLIVIGAALFTFFVLIVATLFANKFEAYRKEEL